MRPLFPLLLLAACSAEPDQPGQLSREEARELNEAAEMLDANSVTAEEIASEEEAE